MSGLMGNHSIFNKPGVRAKFYDHQWNPPKFEVTLSPDDVLTASKRNKQGYCVKRREMTEAIAIFDETYFSNTHEIFSAGPFFAVKGQLADILSRFDLGSGGLVPLPVYEADLVTPRDGKYFMLNFGCRKDSFLAERSEDAQKFIVDRVTGKQLWKINYTNTNGTVTLSKNALIGSDLWIEEAVHNRIFMSDALATKMIEVGLSEDWRLLRCDVVEAHS